MVAARAADIISAIEETRVSDYARNLSNRRTKGEIAGDDGKAALLECYRKMQIVGSKRLMYAPARLILVVFFFPALSLFCGISPAQEQQCFNALRLSSIFS